MINAQRPAGLAEVLGTPAFWRWSIPVALARMPTLMAAVALTTGAALFLGDPDAGGTIVAAHVLGLLALAPLAASLADRFGVARVLRWQLLAAAIAWLALSWVAHAGAPRWSWHLAALVAGACLAGSAGLLRSTLSQAVHHRQLRVASSLDASLLELVIVASPLVVAAAALGAPLGATVVVALIAAAAAAATTLLPRSPLPTTAPSARARLPLSAPLAAWAIAGLAFGLALGSVEIGAVSLAVANGWAPGQAWIFYAVLALSSAAGGLLDARTASLERADHRPRIAAMSALMATGAAIAAASTNPALLLVGVAMIGLPAASLLSARSLRTEAVVTPAVRARAFTLVFAAQSIGFAAAGLALTALGHRGAITAGAIAILASTIIVVTVDRPHRHTPARSPRASTHPRPDQ